MSDSSSITRSLIDFCDELRHDGLPVGTGDAMAYASATALVNPGRLEDLYWAGRVTLARSREQIGIYNAAFTRFFLGGKDGRDREQLVLRSPVRSSETIFTVPSGEQPQEGNDEQETRLGAAAAAVVVDRTKSFAECTEEELESLRRIISNLKADPPTRRTRRRRGTPKGKRLDMRRMARETMRTHGEPGELSFLSRKVKPRPLVLILDISGSMADYSRNLLQFAHSTRRATSRVEIFCFGTKLTRVTPALKRRDPNDAMEQAGRDVGDWAGGTQIGSSLEHFVKKYARRGVARGAVVIICSDGLDRGDPEVLDKALDRLGRLSHQIVWMNPMKGDSDKFEPTTLGMSVAMPHTDLIWSGHNLRSLEEFAEKLPTLR